MNINKHIGIMGLLIISLIFGYYSFESFKNNETEKLWALSFLSGYTLSGCVFIILFIRPKNEGK